MNQRVILLSGCRRIQSVVDAFEALVHERPYKEPWPPGEALAEIRDGPGERYDPRVVRAFLEMSDDLARLKFLRFLSVGNSYPS